MNFNMAAELLKAEGYKVESVVIADDVAMGVALTPCTVPTAGKPTFELKEDEFEFGIGIHGEPGRKGLR